MRLSTRLLLPLLLPLLAACGDNSTGPGSSAAANRAVVLNGTGLTGVTIVADSGPAVTHLTFDPFDGATFTVEGDSVLSTSSSFSGDLLFVASLSGATVQKVQMPARSNPAGAAFIPSGISGSTPATYAVALRNTGSLALARSTGGGAFAVTTVPNVGRCPYDVFFARDAAYVVDANERCESDYASLGSVRLIRVPLTSTGRDTITLSTASAGAPRGFEYGNFALVFTSGTATAAGVVTRPPALAKVDLQTRQVVQTLTFPAGTFGFSARLAEDGLVYATAATGFNDQTLQVYAIDPNAMAFTGTRASGRSYLALTTETGAQPHCSAATSDRNGRLYCVENGRTISTLRIFDSSGKQLSSTQAGSPAYDIALR